MKRSRRKKLFDFEAPLPDLEQRRSSLGLKPGTVPAARPKPQKEPVVADAEGEKGSDGVPAPVPPGVPDSPGKGGAAPENPAGPGGREVPGAVTAAQVEVPADRVPGVKETSVPADKVPDTDGSPLEPGRRGRLRRHPEKQGILLKVGLVLAIMVLLAAGLGISLYFFTGILDVGKVEVNGGVYLNPAHVRGLSGVDSYEKVTHLPLERLEKNLENDPWIRNARVKRRLINTVEIWIEERVPVAVLNYGGAGFLVDGTGFVICGADPGEHPGLVQVNGGDAGTPAIGRVMGPGQVLDSVLTLSEMDDSLRARFLLADPWDPRGLVMRTPQDMEIVYGARTGDFLKEEVLEAILADIDIHQRDVEMVDIRVPGSPALKLR